MEVKNNTSYLATIIVQSLVTLLVLGTVCYLALTQRSIPDWLAALAGVVVSYWLPVRSTQELSKNIAMFASILKER
jgi:Na+/H+ antiporter NhaA